MQISQEMIFGLCLFATVLALSFALSGLVFRRDPLASRLRALAPDERGEERARPNEHADRAHSGRDMVVPVMERIGHVAARPFMPKSAVKQSNLRRQLMHAGIYSSSAMELVVGMKVILLAAGAVSGYVLGNMVGGWFLYVALYVG